MTFQRKCTDNVLSAIPRIENDKIRISAAQSFPEMILCSPVRIQSVPFTFPRPRLP